MKVRLVFCEEILLLRGYSREGGYERVIVKYPKIAGIASPTDSGDLKHPSFPPVAKGLPSRDLVDVLQSPDSATIPLISSSAENPEFVSQKM
jgi:hypothetical protein